MQCIICHRLGHTKNVCSSSPLCRLCGLDKHDKSTCTSDVKCVNCHGSHASTSRECPKWKDEKKICEFMAIDKLSAFEARKRFRQITPKPSMPMSFSEALTSGSSNEKSDENTQLKCTIQQLLTIQKQLQDQLQQQSNQLKKQGELIKELLLVQSTTTQQKQYLKPVTCTTGDTDKIQTTPTPSEDKSSTGLETQNLDKVSPLKKP